MDITITKDGLKILKKLEEKVIEFHAPLMGKLSKEELEILYQLIKKLKNKKNV